MRSVRPETQITPREPRQRPKLVVAFFIFLFVVLLAGIWLFWGEGKKAKVSSEKPPVPVRTAVAQQKDVPLVIRVIAHVEPITTVSVRSRVDGELVAVFFKEGDYVKAGQPLFIVDPRQMQETTRQAEAKVAQCRADIKKAEAMLVRDRSELDRLKANRERDAAEETNARKEWQRYQMLARQGAVSVSEENRYATQATALSATLKAHDAAIANQKASLESDAAQLDSLHSILKAAQAELEHTRLQLSFSKIAAPVTGRTGSLLVHKGNMVKSGDNSALVVINQVKPIYVTFSLPESDLNKIKNAQGKAPLPVSVETSGETQAKEPCLGKLTFIDNTVDRQTGTILFKATFANENGRLWPGEYVTAVLHLETIKDAVLVPSQALQVGQQGQYVYVIDTEGKAVVRPVSSAYTFGEQAVISKGLSAGETVITDGQLQLVPGAKVVVSSAPVLP